MSAVTENPRRLLARLTGAILVLSLLTGALGYLLLDKVARDQARELTLVDSWLTAADLARTAQVHYKIQVQEWKNVLLRGELGAGFAHHRQAMEQQGRLVQDQLGRLRMQLAAKPEVAEEVRVLAAAAEDVLAVYEDQLQGREVLGPDQARSIDQAVRGVDRELDQRLHALTAALRARGEQERLHAGTEGLATTQRAKWVLLGGTLLQILALVVMLSLVLRHRH